jgi:hypothetical protein
VLRQVRILKQDYPEASARALEQLRQYHEQNGNQNEAAAVLKMLNKF